MKILSFQPFTLYRNGGGSRVLRRLYEGHEHEISSLVIEESIISSKAGIIPETIVYATPLQKSWMRWKLRKLASWLRNDFFKKYNQKKIENAAKGIPHDIIHVINHGTYSTALSDIAKDNKKELWVSFHDHYSTCSTFEDTARLWKESDRQFVISEELGIEYAKQFGSRNYEVITDGVTKDEVSTPIQVLPEKVTVYFAGLLHLDYIPLFEVLANVLEQLSKEQKHTYKLVLRGTQRLDFLNDRSFELEYRTNFVTDESIKKELDEATILYLPIKYTPPEFYLYSLSTKMVSYLGASGAIIYHGPGNSAACNLLRKHNAAACCITMAQADLAETLTGMLDQLNELSKNAKVLAKEQFDLQSLRTNIWGTDK